MEAVPNINAAVTKTLATKGIALSQTKYHWLIENGVYFYEDKTEAFNNAKRAAQQGLPWGMSTYAWDLETGYGTEDDKEDKEGAFEWLKKAADLGDKFSQNWVARYYEEGWGDVEKNAQIAVDWYRKSAEQGYSTAQCNLGNMYYNGKGVDKNYKTAKYWYGLAADQGDQDAKRMYDKLWRY